MAKTSSQQHKPQKKRCYIYTRVSTNMQIEGYSLKAQHDRLVKEAQYRDFVIVKEFTDEGKSGKNVSGRPGFQAMMDCIVNRTDNVDYVLVFKLSRFGRNTADVIYNLQLMQDYGVNLICAEEGIDSSGSVGKLIISVISSVAEIERENIREQTMSGREQKAREGKWNGGFAPYGYKLVNGELIIEESEAKTIRRIFELFTTTPLGIAGIARTMTAEGYKKMIRHNGTTDKITAPFIKAVLDNPVYMGKIAYGRRRSERLDGKRNEFHTVKQSEYNVYPGLHEAIVSEETWKIAFERRKDLADKHTHEKIYSLDHEHILSGILKCPVCGSSMYGSVNRKRKKDGTFYKDTFYYVCKHRTLANGVVCSYHRQPPQKPINDEVEAIVLEALRSPMFADIMKKELENHTDENAIQARIDGMKKQIAQHNGAKDKIARTMDNLDIMDPQYEAKYNDLQKRLDQLYDQIALIEKDMREAQAELNSVFQGKATIENAYEMLDLVREVFPVVSDADKKSIMRDMLDSVEIFEERQKNGRYVKAVHFKFPVMIGNSESRDWWYNETIDETVAQLCLK